MAGPGHATGAEAGTVAVVWIGACERAVPNAGRLLLVCSGIGIGTFATVGAPAPAVVPEGCAGNAAAAGAVVVATAAKGAALVGTTPPVDVAAGVAVDVGKAAHGAGGRAMPADVCVGVSDIGPAIIEAPDIPPTFKELSCRPPAALAAARQSVGANVSGAAPAAAGAGAA